jgi:hypothetical protein
MVAPQRGIAYQGTRTACPAQRRNPSAAFGSPHTGLAMTGPPVDNDTTRVTI